MKKSQRKQKGEPAGQGADGCHLDVLMEPFEGIFYEYTLSNAAVHSQNDLNHKS